MAFMDLFRPKWKHSSWVVRKAAVRGLTGQAELAQVARRDDESSIREVALERLTDQAVLAEVATTDTYAGVRGIAVGKLTDQAVLAKVAMTDTDFGVRCDAVAELTDQAGLAFVAKAAESEHVRAQAVTKLIDRALLAEIAKTDSTGKVCLTAADQLADQALFAELARSAAWDWVRKEAAKRLTDQTALVDVATSDKAYTVREAALETLSRLAPPGLTGALAECLRRPEATVREAAAWALGRLGDHSATGPLRTALTGDSSADVRVLAYEALNRLGWQAEPQDVESVIQALDDLQGRLGRSNGSDEAQKCLRVAASRAVGTLVKALLGGKWTARVTAGALLTELEWQPDGNRMRAALAVARQDWSTCVSLGRDSIDDLLTALWLGPDGVKRGAAQALVALRGAALPETVDTLLAALREGNLEVSAVVVDALEEIDWQPPDGSRCSTHDWAPTHKKSIYERGDSLRGWCACRKCGLRVHHEIKIISSRRDGDVKECSRCRQTCSSYNMDW